MIVRKRAWDIARETPSVSSQDSLGQVMAKLDDILVKEPDTHTLLVKDKAGHLVGTLSISDILRFASDSFMAHGLGPEAEDTSIDDALAVICQQAADMPIADIMATEVPRVSPSAPLIFILGEFLSGDHSMIVVEEADRVIGAINIVDLYRETCRGIIGERD